MNCSQPFLQKESVLLSSMTAVQDYSCLFQSTEEQPEPINAEVKGNLPSWLTGTMIRNGPGRFECGDSSFNHWFDGQGLLHRFHVENGHVTYNNKFVRSESYADTKERKNSIHLEFGSFIAPDPCQNIFSRFVSKFFKDEVPFDNAFDTVFTLKNKIYAAADSNIIFEIDPKTLETMRKVNYAKEFPGDAKIKFTTAHPQCAEDGSVFNISVTHAQNSTYDVIEIPPCKGVQDEHPLEGGKLLYSIPPTSGVAYIHSFCITENYVVVPETPLVLNLWEAYTRKFKDSSVAEWFQWKPKQRTRFHVVDRKQEAYVGVFTAEPFFVFHQVNAFERDGKIYLDASCFHDHTIIDQTYLHNMRAPILPGEKKLDVPDIRRYELPLEDLGDVKAGKPLRKGADGLDYTLLYSGMEFPRINESDNNGRPYKFVYGVGADEEKWFSHLVKLNVETREFVTWKEPGGFASEPVFVKAPDGKEEDDGVVLSCVVNIPDQTTYLLVLDAKEFKELGRGVVQGITPMSFHSGFFN